MVCLGQEYKLQDSFVRDCVAIGRPFVGTTAAVGPTLETSPSETQGELWLSGPQLALGYLNEPEETAVRFVNVKGTRWYRTGDLVFRDGEGIFHYLGRIDNQVKILGHRVELEEIEWHLREISNCKHVAVVAQPSNIGASSLVGFLACYKGSVKALLEALSLKLPAYMVPSSIHTLAEMPMTSHGKVDRNALQAKLRDGAYADQND